MSVKNFTSVIDFTIHTVQPAMPITFDASRCNGCNQCVQVCQIDLLVPNEKKGQPPIVAYPDECWYCGCCAMECPRDAIRLHHPLMNQAHWIEKSSLLNKRPKETV